MLVRGDGRPERNPYLGGETMAVTSDTYAAVLDTLRVYYRSAPLGYCGLATCYDGAAAVCDMTIGDFHDTIRELLANGRIRLHPFTGAAYQIDQSAEPYWLVSGQEIKAYVELLRP